MSAVADTVAARVPVPRPGRRRRAGRIRIWVGTTIVGLLLAMALFPGAFARLSPADPDPYACSLRDPNGTFQDRLPPSSEHWFGTDVQGCDYYTRVVHGVRVSLGVAIGAVAVDVAIGVVLGGLAGYLGGRWDRAISRAADLFVGLPQVLTAIVLLTVLAGEQRSVPEVAIVLGLLGWPFSARLFRSGVLHVREQPFVDASIVAGASTPRVLATHVVPNAASPLIVHATLAVGLLIGVEAALAFLGVGLVAPTISWGLMIEPAQARLGETPHLMLFPCLFIAAAALGFLLLGDGLQARLDPREDS